jgi:hypothetical protein
MVDMVLMTGTYEFFIQVMLAAAEEHAAGAGAE